MSRPSRSGEQEIPAGSFIFAGSAYDRLKKEVEALGLTAVALNAAPTVAMHDVDLPRLAIYSTWGNTQEVGWVRYAFDHFEVPYDLIYKERVKQGNLRAAYDVIVIPNQGRSGKGLVYDIAPRPGSRRWPTPNRISSRISGCTASREDITGGMGLEGVVEFRKFVDSGGVLITLGTASAFPAGIRNHPRHRSRPHLAAILRAGADRGGGDSAAGESDLLRLHGEDDSGAMGEWSAVDRAGEGSRKADPDAFPRRRRGRAERPDARSE